MTASDPLLLLGALRGAAAALAVMRRSFSERPRDLERRTLADRVPIDSGALVSIRDSAVQFSFCDWTT